MKRQTMIILGVYIISWIGTLVSYFYLPDQLLIGAVPILIYLLGKAFLRVDPNARRLKKQERTYDRAMSVISVLFLGVNRNTIYMAFCEKAGSPARIQLYPLLFGLVLIMIGNMLPIVRHNYFLGIRTPWTLAGEISWRKTHRTGGYLFVLCGLILCAGVLTRWKALYGGAFGFILGSVAILYLYSYLIYQRYDQKKKEAEEPETPMQNIAGEPGKTEPQTPQNSAKESGKPLRNPADGSDENNDLL